MSRFQFEWFAVLATVLACGNTIEGPAIPHERGRAGSAGTGAEQAGTGGSALVEAGTGGSDTGEAGTGGSDTARGGSAGRRHDGASGEPSNESGGGTNRGGSTNQGHAGRATEDGGASGEGTRGDHAGAGGEQGGESGAPNTTGGAGGEAGAVPGDNAAGVVLVPDVSVRKRVRASSGRELVLEETLAGFAATTSPKTRIRSLTANLHTAAQWAAPDATYISDFCVHPSGELSIALISDARVVSLVRLDSSLHELGSKELHDPETANDPHASEAGIVDLVASGMAYDAARIGANGEAVFTVVVSNFNALIGYRQSFVSGDWSAPARTLIEPPVGLTPFLPTGGSFDTFGAITAWSRPSLDLDENGNAYVAIWAHPIRVREHKALFDDGLVPLPGDPAFPTAGDSDILLTKLDANGVRSWSRVIGSEHEDEPYALRVHGGFVAVVGRSRRFPSFDNTFWDALVSVTSTVGDTSESRTLELDASSILLAVEGRTGGGFWVGGSDGWSQNPEGLSVTSNGKKLLLELPSLADAPVRHDLAPGPRHNELRSLLAMPGGLAFAGHEDGPIMHTGDGDPSQIHSTGVLGFLPN